MKRGRKPSLIKCCPKCGETDRDKFGPNRRRSDGLQVWCKSCYSNHFNKHAYRYSLTYKYGLSEADYQDMMRKQNDLCALCKKPFNVGVDKKNVTPRWLTTIIKPEKFGASFIRVATRCWARHLTVLRF